MIPDWLYETGPNGFWVFLLLTVVFGGAAAWTTGRAIAATWRPFWQVAVYAVLLTFGVRFLHFALFGEPLLAIGNFLVDASILIGAGTLGHRLARASAMTTQYGWLFERAGQLGWRPRKTT